MSRKRAQEEHENPERWMVSYADFITLLFAFFTVLYATSNQDIEKAKKFENSIKKAFLAVVEFGRGSGPGDYVQTDEDASPIAPPIPLFKRLNPNVADLVEAVEASINKSLSKDEKEKVHLELREDEFGVRLSLDSSALFDDNSTAMKKDVLATFDKIAIILKESNKNLIIEGHTDNQVTNSTVYPSNWEFAAARASTILRYLLKVHKISASKLAAVSLADQRPIASNETEVGRKKNRRIEILLATKNTSMD